MVERTNIETGYNSYQIADSRLKERESIYTELKDNDASPESRQLPDSNHQAIQLAASADNLLTAEKKARTQIEKGYLDIRI